jgi:hypothetical protein
MSKKYKRFNAGSNLIYFDLCLPYVFLDVWNATKNVEVVNKRENNWSTGTGNTTSNDSLPR